MSDKNPKNKSNYVDQQVNFVDLVDLPFAHPQPVIYEDWKAYVNRPDPIRPKVPSRAAFRKMSKDEQDKSRKQRMIYNAAFPPLKTDKLIEVSEDFILFASNNVRANSGARGGAVINGLGTLGKTTIMLQIGRTYEQKRRRQMAVLRGRDDLMESGWVFIPVVYIVLPGTTTPKNLYTSLARFYNVPLPRTYSLEYVKGQVMMYARNCGTSLVMVDDIHYLDMKNRTSRELNNHLKEFANCVPATLLYAGIDCDGVNLFGEGKS